MNVTLLLTFYLLFIIFTYMGSHIYYFYIKSWHFTTTSNLDIFPRVYKIFEPIL